MMKTLNWKVAGVLGALLLSAAAPGHAETPNPDNWQTFDIDLGPGDGPDTVSIFSIDTPVLPEPGMRLTAGAGTLAEADTVWKVALDTPKLGYTLVLSGKPVADGFDPKAEAKTMAVAQTKVRSTTADVPVKLPGIQAGAVLVENTRATGQKTDNLIASFLIHKRTLNLTLTFDPADKSARQTAYGILTSARAADGVNRTKDGFTIEDLRVGDGPEAKAGQHVTVHYRGTLADGAVFDESYKRGQPFGFDLGAGQVIKGWDQGVAGMKVGGRRKLVIPPALAYGDAGAGGVIPPKSTLTFVVELLDVN